MSFTMGYQIKISDKLLNHYKSDTTRENSVLVFKIESILYKLTAKHGIYRFINEDKLMMMSQI